MSWMIERDAVCECCGQGTTEEIPVRVYLLRTPPKDFPEEHREELTELAAELRGLANDARRMRELMPTRQQRITQQEMQTEQLIEEKAAKVLGLRKG